MIIRNIVQSGVIYMFKNVKWASYGSHKGYATAAGTIQSLGKIKKKGKQMGPVIEKVVLPVETDAKVLVTFVCGSNINKEGKDIKLKEDTDYPEWLWKLNTGKVKPLDELDPETLEYWRRVRKMNMRRNNELAKLKKF